MSNLPLRLPLLVALTALYGCDLSAEQGEFSFLSDDDPDRLTVLSWNIAESASVADVAARGPGIVDRLKKSPHDVIALQEAVDDSVRESILAELQEEFPYRSELASPATFTRYNGGVIILSRWPIVTTEVKPYSSAGQHWAIRLHAGMAYARIQKGEGRTRTYSIFATHMSGWNARGAAARAQQRTELRDWIASKTAVTAAERIPASEPIIMPADYNADYYTPEFYQLTEVLGAGLPPIMRCKSDDPDRVHGADEGRCDVDETSRQTVTTRPHPVSDADVFTWDSNSNDYADDGERQWIDYVLFRTDHEQPVASRMFIERYRGKVNGQERDLSDHYAVTAEFEFAPVTN